MITIKKTDILRAMKQVAPILTANKRASSHLLGLIKLSVQEDTITINSMGNEISFQTTIESEGNEEFKGKEYLFYGSNVSISKNKDKGAFIQITPKDDCLEVLDIETNSTYSIQLEKYDSVDGGFTINPVTDNKIEIKANLLLPFFNLYKSIQKKADRWTDSLTGITVDILENGNVVFVATDRYRLVVKVVATLEEKIVPQSFYITREGAILLFDVLRDIDDGFISFAFNKDWADFVVKDFIVRTKVCKGNIGYKDVVGDNPTAKELAIEVSVNMFVANLVTILPIVKGDDNNSMKFKIDSLGLNISAEGFGSAISNNIPLKYITTPDFGWEQSFNCVYVLDYVKHLQKLKVDKLTIYIDRPKRNPNYNEDHLLNKQDKYIKPPIVLACESFNEYYLLSGIR